MNFGSPTLTTAPAQTMRIDRRNGSPASTDLSKSDEIMPEIPPYLPYLVVVGTITAFVAVRLIWRSFAAAFPIITIHEHERAVKYVRGRLTGVVEPGQFRYRASTTELSLLDMREQTLTVAGQDVLSSDALGFKFSLQCSYRIVDPVKAVSVVANYYSGLYADLHAATRAVVESMTCEDILANRPQIGSRIEASVRETSTRYGVEVIAVSVRDCMLPGNLKQIYVKVAEAKQEGLAALERARGESAALRNLANAARALEGNPNLAFLRLLQSLEKSSGQHVLAFPAEVMKMIRNPDPNSSSGQ